MAVDPSKYSLSQRVLSFSRQLMGALKTDRATRLSALYPQADATTLVDHILDDLGITPEWAEKSIDNIPTEGPFIAVVNHPFGGIDGLLMLKLLLTKRTDVRIMAHFMLSAQPLIDSYFDPLNASAIGSSQFAEKASRQLAKGGGLVVFPSAMVSAYNLKAKTVRDRIWRPEIVQFIHQSGVPVLPVYIKGSNKLLVHLLWKLNPRLLEKPLPAGLFGNKGRVVHIRVGKPLTAKDLREFDDPNEFSRYLRAKVYMLGSGISVTPFFRPGLFKKRWEKVVPSRDLRAIQEEIDGLIARNAMLHESKDFQVFWAQAEWIRNILYEIGRLREITFRAVGEGTGKHIDLDEYDLYYRHLFIWDKAEKKIVGAYRLGMGKEILLRLGKRGFYLHSLFSMKPSFQEVLGQSIELGRSFVTKEYQLKPLSLFLLWKGILYFILKHPEYRYLIGPVSISGEFSKLSKYLIISFIKQHYFDSEMAAMVRPRHEYIPEVDVEDPDMEALRKITEEDIKKLDRIVEEIEMGNFRLPALLKKYLGQNARIIAFNVDPKFNNALDGLLVMDLFNVPTDTLYGLAKEFDDKELISKFSRSAEKEGGTQLET